MFRVPALFYLESQLDSPSSQQSQLTAYGYSEPGPEIVALVDAPRLPLTVVSPNGHEPPRIGLPDLRPPRQKHIYASTEQK